MAPPCSQLRFSVRRHEPALVAPAAPTPREFKRLSDIDDQEALRFHLPVIQFYRAAAAPAAAPAGDPARIIRGALARALVFYYPFAGRLREAAGRKLVVECTGEGVLFVEADADVRLEQFGAALQPPFPGLDELIWKVPGSDAVLGAPLLLIQVTRLLCGGFIVGLRLNHTMSDTFGLVQFMNAVAELARGATSPTVSPVWAREIMEARNPRRPTFIHHAYDDVPVTLDTIIPIDAMVHRSFFFGASEVAALRRSVPLRLRASSTFEILTAWLWKCRTAAISAGDDEEVRLICVVGARCKRGIGLPPGYYGNAFAFSAAIAKAGELRSNPVGYAIELLKKAKAEVTAEYIQSLADLLVLRGRPHFTVMRSYLVSDVTRVGLGDVDFGWGKPVYGGPAEGAVGVFPAVLSYCISCRNSKGEDGIMVPVYLPHPAMEKFASEMERMMRSPAAAEQRLWGCTSNKSSL